MSNQQDSEQVQIIKKRYKSSLHEKAETIKQYIDILEESVKLSSESEIELHEFLHKLAGSSGMYGFSDIAQNCRDLMGLVKEQDQEKLHQPLVNVYNLLQQHAE